MKYFPKKLTMTWIRNSYKEGSLSPEELAGEIVRRAGITEVVTQGKYLRVSPVELRDSQVMRLKRLHPGTVIKAAVRQVLVPLPLTSRVGGSPLTDGPLLEWVETLVTKILVPFGE